MNTRVDAMNVKYLIYLFLDPFCGTVVSENWSTDLQEVPNGNCEGCKRRDGDDAFVLYG
jgi:hypothetical protein